MRDVIAEIGADDLSEDEHGQYATGLTWGSFLLKRDSMTRKVCNALDSWRASHNIAPKDLWVLDAALQTIAFAALREQEPSEWVYFPPERVWPKFVPEFRRSTWLRGEDEPWPIFAIRMHAQFAKQLNRY